MSGNNEEFVRVKVTRNTRKLIRLLAAKMDITMMEAVATAVAEMLRIIEEREKKIQN